MENKKFRVITGTDENGNPIRKFVPYDEGEHSPQFAVYGNYVVVDEAQIAAAKKELLQDLFYVIEELAKKDSFWIVKNHEENKCSVAWKIHIPQMDTV